LIFPAKSVAGGGCVYDYVVVTEAVDKKIIRETLATGWVQPSNCCRLGYKKITKKLQKKSYYAY